MENQKGVRESELGPENTMAAGVQDAARNGKSRGEGVCAGVAALCEDQ